MSLEFGVKTDLLNSFSECDVKTGLVDNYVLRTGVKTSLNDNHFLGVWIEDRSRRQVPRVWCGKQSRPQSLYKGGFIETTPTEVFPQALGSLALILPCLALLL